MSHPFLTPARLATQHVPGFLFPPHVQAFQGHFLRLLADPHYNRVVVECAVRHGKSFSWSQLFPAWYLLTQPGKHVMLCAHTHDLAGEFVSWIRAFIRRVGPRVGRYVDPEQQSASHVRVLGNGPPSELYGTGRGGAVAGRGAHLLVGDDLIRDQAEANSPTVRRATNVWWQAEALRRLEPGGKVVMAMSRRHPEDLSGFCLAQNGALDPREQWHSVKFPAIQADGTALWPQRFDLAKLQRERNALANVGDEHLFDCLYQQNPRGDPSTAEWPDAYFPDSLWFTELPPSLPVRLTAMACDASKGSKSKTGDDTAIVGGHFDQQETLWLTELYLRPGTSEQAVAQYAAMIRRFRPRVASMESAQFQEALVREVRAVLDQAGVRVDLRPYDPGSEDKKVRIRLLLSGMLRRHRLRVQDGPYGRRLVNQLRAFPSGEHDDGPDALAQLVDLITACLK